MTGLLRLGLRLAGGGGAGGRLRAAMLALASAIGCWVLLATLAIARAEQYKQPSLFDSPDIRRLVLVVVGSIGISVLVLTVTASRLSSVLRDRRLASLRLLGLTPAQTRTVAALEVGATACIGSILGLMGFWATSSALQGLRVAGRDWSDAPFRPTPGAAAVVLVLLPVVTMLAAVLPSRGLTSASLATAHAAAVRRPSLLRLLPVMVGTCMISWLAVEARSGTMNASAILVLFVGGALTAVGVIVAMPVVVSVAADVLLHFGRGAVATLAGRRLQAQPAVMTRIVAGLLLGTFVVAGARCVVAAFEATPQYESAAAVHFGTTRGIDVSVSRASLAQVRSQLDRLAAVSTVSETRLLQNRCSLHTSCDTAVIGSCESLQRLGFEVDGCVNGQTQWLDSGDPVTTGQEASSIRLRPSYAHRNDPELRIPPPTITAQLTPGPAAPDWTPALLIPADTPGVAGLQWRGMPQLHLVVSGRSAEQAVEHVFERSGSGSWIMASLDEYYFVAGLRALVWAVAAVIVSTGLFAFAMSAIDGALARRGETIRIQVLGTSRSTVRRAEAWEAGLPLLLGLPLSIGLGWWVGTAYLSLAEGLGHSPWRDEVWLAMACMAAGACAVVLVVATASPRIRPDLIRHA